jgi:hypothetical protein
MNTKQKMLLSILQNNSKLSLGPTAVPTLRGAGATTLNLEKGKGPTNIRTGPEGACAPYINNNSGSICPPSSTSRW